ncbi:MAG: hypothetical protein HZC02_02805 [Candidatus Levybacteria bacterium]|nr:hypothetical protein [Candidatus Levybacteria bacterium]
MSTGSTADDFEKVAPLEGLRRWEDIFHSHDTVADLLARDRDDQEISHEEVDDAIEDLRETIEDLQNGSLAKDIDPRRLGRIRANLTHSRGLMAQLEDLHERLSSLPCSRKWNGGEILHGLAKEGISLEDLDDDIRSETDD